MVYHFILILCLSQFVFRQGGLRYQICWQLLCNETSLIWILITDVWCDFTTHLFVAYQVRWRGNMWVFYAFHAVNWMLFPTIKLHYTTRRTDGSFECKKTIVFLNGRQGFSFKLSQILMFGRSRQLCFKFLNLNNYTKKTNYVIKTY